MMPETRQQKSNLGPDMAEVLKAEIDQYFKSDSFLESLKFFVQSSVEQACALIVERMVTPLRNKIHDLKSELANVRRKCNENEQYSRRANIRIFGIPEEKGEDCMKKTLAFLDEQLGLKFKESDIDRVHRVGRPRTNATRALIVKFMAYRSKVQVLKIKKVKLDGKKIYINEDLTYCNLRHLQRVRVEHKDCPVWTVDGKVFFRTEAGKSEHVPNNIDDFVQSLYAY